MRLSGFTRMVAMIGFFGAIAIMLISALQFDSEEVSRKDVLLAEVLFGIPIFTVVGAAIGAGWDFFEKRAARAMERPADGTSSSAETGPAPVSPAPGNPNRRHRRKPPGGRRQR